MISQNTSPRRFRVRLDIERIGLSLGRADKTEYTQDYVINFLRLAGFTPDSEREGWWIVDEPELGAVQPDEVLEIEVL